MELRVVRFTPNFDAACAFYGDLLGWPMTHSWPASNGGGRGCIFGYGESARLEFVESKASEAVAGVFVSVQHSDVQAVHQLMVAAEVAILRAMVDTTWGHRSFAVNDPTGLELVHFQLIN